MLITLISFAFVSLSLLFTEEDAKRKKMEADSTGYHCVSFSYSDDTEADKEKKESTPQVKDTTSAEDLFVPTELVPESLILVVLYFIMV